MRTFQYRRFSKNVPAGIKLPMNIGDKVTWNHVPRGGYGYVIPIPAIIKKINPKTVTIEVGLKGGGTKQIRVKRENLRIP